MFKNLGNAFFYGLSAIPIAMQVSNDMHTARKERRNVAWAGISSSIRNGWQTAFLVGVSRPGLVGAGLAALQIAPAVIGTSYGAIQYQNNFIRQSVTPFSQRFEHTDSTWHQQQRGMQTINGSRSFLGSEAGAFARRYGRR